MKKNITVCIVDDDRGTRELISELISEEKDRFSCLNLYPNAEEAIAGLPADAPDIVLMDINMPGANGIECIRQLKPSLPATNFVILTVYDEAEYIFEALAVGAVGYLLKRTIVTDLLLALEDAASGGSPMDSTIARKVVQSFQKPNGNKLPSELDELSERETQVLNLLARGRLYKEIADELDISIHTVHTYIRRIYEKLHVHSRTEAIAKLTGFH
ncbi:Transcriptional regulatory protein DegU [Pontiella desulfatans]|uniref:Transcriptional regulatory protein DegU n=1 Tax=Pontiella desulfatans TaxID=2750659 RepID=A0A6C2U023_PONDE|nr:response regulator transcription factor [Pontiella desulfatans]VGO13300.1 Transcriptional regulatory protein DegU [Pontiella desulfatans]